jgi:hypothetical protein
MRLDSAGNLGLGVTPVVTYGESSKFTIDATGKTNGIYINFNGTGADKQIFLTNGGNANCFVGTDNIAMTFGTGNTERARISSDGTFRVKGAGTAGSTDAFQVAGTAPADSMVLNSSGNLGVGTATPQNDNNYGGLTVNGTSGSIITLRAGNVNSGRIYTTTVDNINIDANGTASGTIIFRTGTGSTERARITSTGVLDIGTGAGAVGQIQFPATQVASSNANTLDDYEEGTWTPVDQSGAGLTFSSSEGVYTKVGNVVFFSFNLIYPSTASGLHATIGGFPFNGRSSGVINPGSAFITYTNTNQSLTLPMGNSSSQGAFYGFNGSAITNATLSSGVIRMSGVIYT